MGMFSGAAGALGGLGLSEGIFDWANVFTGGDRPGPTTATGPAQVHLHERAADLPGGGLMDQLGFRHWWLRTPNREAGMGPETGGVPGERFELPGMTTINDHTGQAADTTGTDIHTTPVPGVDPARVDELLQLGRPTGPWIPFLNDCNSTMDDVLEDAGAGTRDRPLLSPVHSRSLHDVIAGRASDGQTATTGILGALGGIGGAIMPSLGLGMLGAGAAGYLSGTTASWLEDQGRTTEAEAVSILGMGASGASIGAGIGGLAGAGIGGALGLIGGSAMSLFGDESSTSSRVEVPGLGTSISAEEGVGIGGMAAGGALLGTMICPGLGTAIGGGIGGLVGLGASLWD
jgi:hypothetical protein